MTEERHEEQTTMLPSLSTMAKGAATVVAIGMIISAGFAVYNWYTEEEEEEASDDGVEE